MTESKDGEVGAVGEVVVKLGGYPVCPDCEGLGVRMEDGFAVAECMRCCGQGEIMSEEQLRVRREYTARLTGIRNGIGRSNQERREAQLKEAQERAEARKKWEEGAEVREQHSRMKREFDAARDTVQEGDHYVRRVTVEIIKKSVASPEASSEMIIDGDGRDSPKMEPSSISATNIGGSISANRMSDAGRVEQKYFTGGPVSAEMARSVVGQFGAGWFGATGSKEGVLPADDNRRFLVVDPEGREMTLVGDEDELDEWYWETLATIPGGRGVYETVAKMRYDFYENAREAGRAVGQELTDGQIWEQWNEQRSLVIQKGEEGGPGSPGSVVDSGAVEDEEVDKVVQEALGDELRFVYKNWRGEVGIRRAVPVKLEFMPGNEYHPESGWTLRSLDMDKGEMRDFRLADCDFRIEKERLAENRSLAQASSFANLYGKTDGSSRADLYTNVSKATGVDRDSVKRVLLAAAYSGEPPAAEVGSEGVDVGSEGVMRREDVDIQEVARRFPEVSGEESASSGEEGSDGRSSGAGASGSVGDLREEVVDKLVVEGGSFTDGIDLREPILINVATSSVERLTDVLLAELGLTKMEQLAQAIADIVHERKSWLNTEEKIQRAGIQRQRLNSVRVVHGPDMTLSVMVRDEAAIAQGAEVVHGELLCPQAKGDDDAYAIGMMFIQSDQNPAEFPSIEVK